MMDSSHNIDAAVIDYGRALADAGEADALLAHLAAAEAMYSSGCIGHETIEIVRALSAEPAPPPSKEYVVNPKMRGSGVLACIPQKGTCPVGCPDCFFQSGRSYLEPLDEKTPNVPAAELADGFVVRMNDGNDSANQRGLVQRAAGRYRDAFYNTSSVHAVPRFDGPVVLTLNPGRLTDEDFAKLKDPENMAHLMFVRFRANTWNRALARRAIEYYTKDNVPVVLTWMAYHDAESIPEPNFLDYAYRKRTTNAYYAIRFEAWKREMDEYAKNPYVYSCGKAEGIPGGTGCRRCGNCLREYFATKARMAGGRV